MQFTSRCLFLIFLLIQFCCFVDKCFALQFPVPEDFYLTVPDIIRKYGYPCEEHTVTTKDGYILTLHRIPRRQSGISRRSTFESWTPSSRVRTTTNANSNFRSIHVGGNIKYAFSDRPEENEIETSPVVLLQHGIAQTSDVWVILGPEKALAYLLADEGYDVWLGNSRGTRYSFNHTRFDPIQNKRQFWDFSFHELGVGDLTASVDYILNVTAEERLSFIGHSQGNTAFLAMCAENEEYNNKISKWIGLAPVSFIQSARSAIILSLGVLETPGVLTQQYNMLGAFNLVPRTPAVGYMLSQACAPGNPLQYFCVELIFIMGGANPPQVNNTFVQVVYGHFPGHTSSKEALHYTQLLISGEFRKFDYGAIRNLFRYGRRTPPRYDLSRVRVPTYLYYGANDLLATPTDVNRLARRLSNVRRLVQMPDERWSHTDFTYARDARTRLYQELVDIL